MTANLPAPGDDLAYPSVTIVKSGTYEGFKVPQKSQTVVPDESIRHSGYHQDRSHEAASPLGWMTLFPTQRTCVPVQISVQ